MIDKPFSVFGVLAKPKPSPVNEPQELQIRGGSRHDLSSVVFTIIVITIIVIVSVLWRCLITVRRLCSRSADLLPAWGQYTHQFNNNLYQGPFSQLIRVCGCLDSPLDTLLSR